MKTALTLLFIGSLVAQTSAAPFPGGTPYQLDEDPIEIQMAQPAPGSQEEILTGADQISVSFISGLRANPPARVAVNVPSTGANFCLPALYTPANPQWDTAVFDIIMEPQNGTISAQPGNGCFRVTMSAGASIQKTHVIYSVALEDRPRRYGIIDLIKQGAY